MLSKVLALALLILFSTSNAVARDYFVDASNGTTNGAGTIANPLLKIQSAIDLAAPGDTIFVRAGTYPGALRFSRSGEKLETETFPRRITLKGYQNERPIIDLQGGYDLAYAAQQILLESTTKAPNGASVPIRYITIDGFVIRNGYNGIKMYNANYVVISHNIICDNARQGILGNGLDVTFDSNIICRSALSGGADQTSNQYHGMYFGGTRVTVINNIFHSNLGYGLQIAGYTLGMVGQYNEDYSNAKFWLVSNNVFAYQRLRAGITVYYSGASDNRIQNNIFFNNSLNYQWAPNGVDFLDSGPRNELKNNLYFSSLGRIEVLSTPASPSVYTESGRISNDPKFKNSSIDPVTNQPTDFSLNSDSPAIDRPGVTAPEVVHDFRSTRRPQGTGTDIGAFEYIPPAPPAVPLPPTNLKVK